MDKMAVLLIVFGVVSLAIAIYQFIDDRLFYGMLSVVYSLVFFVGGRYNLRKEQRHDKAG